MIAIEKDIQSLRGALPKDSQRPALDKIRLSGVIDLFSFEAGDKDSRSKDGLSRVYDYFLGRFESAEGQAGREIYTYICC